MGIRLGPFDPLQLIFEIINHLGKKGLMSPAEAKELLKKTVDPNLSEKEKDKIVNNLIGGSNEKTKTAEKTEKKDSKKSEDDKESGSNDESRKSSS